MTYLNRKNLHVLFIILVVMLILPCCREKSIDPSSLDMGYTYYPLDSGLYREYLVQQINYAADGSIDSSSWYYKEIQGAWTLDESGDSVMTIERYKTNDTTADWEIDSLFRIRKNNLRVIATEDNIPYVRLVFPVVDSEKWNGNAYNSLGEQDFQYSNAGKETEVQGKKFPVTVTVIEKEIDDHIVNYVKKDDIYASNTGLIYKEIIDYYYCQEEGCLGQQIISYGTVYKQWLIKSGYE